MNKIKTNIIKLNPYFIKFHVVFEAISVIKRGGVIVYPTDTIYGLGCDATNAKAVERIFEIKHRSEQNPALILASNLRMVNSLVRDIQESALVLMKNFWPGPLTIIFKAREQMNPLLVSSDGKIGIRIPKNNFCMYSIKILRKPIVSTSANISGQETILSVKSLIETFNNKVELIIDAGDLKSSVPSTVVDVTGEKPVLIREGAITNEMLSKYIQFNS